MLSPQPSGVFSRLDGPADPADDPGDDPGEDPEALPYAGVLKKRRECSGSPSEAQDGAVSSSVSPWGCGKVSSSCGPGSVFRRLGRKPD